MKAPLIVRSLIPGNRYLTAVVMTLLGGAFLVLWGLGILGLPPLIAFASIFLVLFGPASAANTFLGYPRLIVSGHRLMLESTMFTARRVDLTPYGQAYVAHYPGRRGAMHTDLVFRTGADEAAHRAAEKFPYGPEIAEAAMNLSINAFVGHDVDKGEALATEINRQRGM